MPLRELLARFGVQFDDTQLKKGISSIDGLAGKMRAFAGVAAAIAIGRGIANFIDRIRETADELDKTGIQLGIATGDLQAWRFAAGLAGVEGTAFSQSLGILQRNAFEAGRGSTAMADSFRRLGVSVKDSNGNLKDGNTLLTEVGQGLSVLDNDSERVALSLTLMGRSGRQLLPLFTQGAEGVALAREEFERLGGGLSEETIAASVELTDEMTRYDTAMEGVRSTIALAVLPTLNRLAQFFTQVSVKLGELTAGTHAVELVFVTLGVAALALAVKMLAAFAAPIAIFLLVAVAVGVVILLLDDLITLFEGGDSVIGDFIDTLFGVGTAAEWVENLKMAWEGLTLAVKDAGNAVADFLGADRPFDDTESGRASNDPATVARRQRQAAAIQGTIARTGDEGPQDMESLVAEANMFRLESGATTGFEFDAERFDTTTRRFTREELASVAANRTGANRERRVAAPRERGAAGTVNQETMNQVTINAQGADAAEVETRVRRLLTQLQGEDHAAALAALVPEAGDA